jgi:hypothetical protein
VHLDVGDLEPGVSGASSSGEPARFGYQDPGEVGAESMTATGTTILRTAIQAPRMNATCERLVGTLRREVLDRKLILGQAHLRAVLTEYQMHYNTARPHQGIAHRVPDRPCVISVSLDTQQIRRKPVLSGLINEYTQAA